MSKRKVEPQDVFWNQLYRIRKRPCHAPHEMRSAQSQPPIKSWLCDECAAYTGLFFTYGSSNETPWCNGSSRTVFPQEDA